MRSRIDVTQPAASRPWRTIAALAVVLGCAGIAAVLVKRGQRAEEVKIEGTKSVEHGVAATRIVEVPSTVVTAKEPVKARGIRVCDLSEGSRLDPAAPLYPLAEYEARRTAELKKWKETTIDLSFQDASINDIVTEIARRWGLKLGLDAGISPNQRLSVSISGSSAADTMDFLGDFNNLAWVVDGNGDSWLVPSEKKEMYESKEGRDLATLAGTAAQVEADRAPEMENPADAVALKRIEETRFSPNRTGLSLLEMQTYVFEETKIGINLDPMKIPDQGTIRISMAGENVTVRAALDAALAPAGLCWRISDGCVLVTTPAEIARRKKQAEVAESARQERVKQQEDFLSKPVTLEGDGLSIRDVAERISKAIGVGYVIDPATWSRAARYGFDGEPHTLREIFQALSKGAPVEVSYRSEKLWFVSRGEGK